MSWSPNQVQYCFSETFPETYTKFHVVLYRAVRAFQKRIGILLTNSNGNLMSLFFRFMKGSALKL